MPKYYRGIKLSTVAQLKNDPFAPLYGALSAQIQQLVAGERATFEITVRLANFKPFPYVQGVLEPSGQIRIEFVSNVYLEPDLTVSQREEIKAIGWNRPNGKVPNYSKTIDSSQSSMTIAIYLVTSLRVVMGFSQEDWFCLGDSELDIELSQSNSFWHSLSQDQWICLPNTNLNSTIEGKS